MDLIFNLLRIAAFLFLCEWFGKLVLRATCAGPFLKKSMNEERFDVLAMLVRGVAFCLSVVGLVYLTAWCADVL